ncbi:hypothetical protein TTHERM_00812820 (macronuclear) [Tetrahymena thermophila SB210]|uniref:Uncharacterized protein n=1 Tax=Tetrahymena thermophila (strain SB210) TaxID=312017 RepID=Q22SU9_TETTS|nr:hypothetical protein TTHERM_00812820 [Tetrahymena thermophila SB210]EAR88365.2 hypothetical protein TTHERM_00812820 [Tetrahymena thermophila SB210]|eukprot:XP_001008610.2 hypothetical protein TTHERM_00812820 [Tetrahymena thermophila SB210]
MGSFQEEYGYLFDKDFYSIQEYIQQFNEGITTINPDEIQSEKDLLEQLTYQVKMYGTKIIELYDVLDQYAQTDRTQLIDDQQQHHQHQQALKKIQNLELEKEALLERLKSVQMNMNTFSDNSIDKIYIMSNSDHNWSDIIQALEEAFRKEESQEEGFELLQTLDYKINTSNIKQFCEWLGACNRQKDNYIERLQEKLPRLSNENTNLLRFMQPNGSFFSIARDLSKNLDQLQNQMLQQQTQYTNKIEYLNQQITELTQDMSINKKTNDPAKKNSRNSSLERGSFSTNYSLKDTSNTNVNLIMELQEQLKLEQQEKDKYLQDLQEIYGEYESLKNKYENLQDASKQNYLKEQLEELKNELSKFKNESSFCNLQEQEKIKEQLSEKENQIEIQSSEISELKKKLNEQIYENKQIREEEEKKWEKKHNEMVEDYKKQLREEKQRELTFRDLNKQIEEGIKQMKQQSLQIEQLEQEKIELEQKLVQIQSSFEESQNQQKQAESVKIQLESEVKELQNKLKQQEQEQISTQSKQSQLDQQIQLLKDSLNQFQKQHKTSLQYEESIRELEKKVADLIEENNQLQDTFTRTVEELVQKNQIISNLQDELFTTNEEMKAYQQNQHQMSKQFDELIDLKEQKWVVLETDNSNLKQSLKLSEQELTECKQQIQQMNVQFEKFKQSYIEKIRMFGENIDQIKEQNEKQMQLKEKELSQLKQNIANQEELIQHYEEALNIKEEKLANSQSQNSSNTRRILRTQDLQTSLNESSSRFSFHNTEDLFNKLTKYKKQVIKLKEKQAELVNELEISRKSFSDLLLAQKELESKYIQLQTEYTKTKIVTHSSSSKEVEQLKEEFIKLQERYESIQKENSSLRNGIFCKDNTFKELEKLMSVNEELLSEIENYKSKLIQKDEEIIKEKILTKQQILAAHKKIDELQRKVQENQAQGTSRSTYRSSSTHRSHLQEITKEVQENQKNILSKQDLQTLLTQKNQEISRLNQIVKSISGTHIPNNDNVNIMTKKKF